jgi:hypothetical protein
MSSISMSRGKYSDVTPKMQEAGYDVMSNGEFLCTSVNYVVDLFDGEVCVFIAPNPYDDEFGDGLNIGRLVDAELQYTREESGKFAYLKVRHLNFLHVPI